MIRNAIYTTYMGKEYIISRGNMNGKVYFRIRSNNPEVLNLGFRLSDNGVANCFVKEVTASEVGEVYHINTAAEYKGVIVGVEKENDAQYLLYKSHDKYGSLGFDLVAKGEYEKWIDKAEVTNVHEVKRPIPDFFED